jgi:hypothetical protein
MLGFVEHSVLCSAVIYLHNYVLETV